MADITADVSDLSGLLKNLESVWRTVAPKTHPTVLLMPSQAFTTLVLAENPAISNAKLVAHMSDAGKIYAKYFINGKLQNPSPSCS